MLKLLIILYREKQYYQSYLLLNAGFIPANKSQGLFV